MTQPPRRLRPDNSERVSVVVNRVASGSASGSTRYARPVPGGIGAALRSLPPVKAEQYVLLGQSRAVSGLIPDHSLPAGPNAWTDDTEATAVGDDAQATASRGTTVGCQTRAGGVGASAYGFGAAADATDSLALGDGSRVDTPFDGGVAVGVDANVLTAYDIQLGTTLHTVSIWTPLHTSAGAATGTFLPVRLADGNIKLLPLYNLP